MSRSSGDGPHPPARHPAVLAVAEQELHLNTDLTKLVHQLTTDIHSRVMASPAPREGDPAASRTST
jgi:hypothetical protein